MMPFALVGPVFASALTFGFVASSSAPASPPPSAPSSSANGAEDPSQATAGATSAAPSTPPPASSPASPKEAPAASAPIVEDGGPVTPENPSPEPPGLSDAQPIAQAPAAGAPLPAPAPPVAQSAIARGPWRGTMWFSFLGTLAFPMAGDEVVRGDGLATLGGFFQAGVRPLSWLGIGAGIGTQPHLRSGFDDGVNASSSYRRISFFDLPLLRFYLPTKGIFAPYAEASTGFAFIERISYITSTVGSQSNVGVGFDLWFARNVSLNLSARYRLIAFDGEVGHQMATLFGVTIHR